MMFPVIYWKKTSEVAIKISAERAKNFCNPLPVKENREEDVVVGLAKSSVACRTVGAKFFKLIFKNYAALQKL